MVYVCFLRIKEAIPFSLEKKDHIYLTRMLAWRRIWWLLQIIVRVEG